MRGSDESFGEHSSFHGDFYYGFCNVASERHARAGNPGLWLWLHGDDCSGDRAFTQEDRVDSRVTSAIRTDGLQRGGSGDVDCELNLHGAMGGSHYCGAKG